jgi:hypothetical protein
MSAISEIELRNLESAKLIMQKAAAGNPTMAVLIAWAELYLARHGQTSPIAPPEQLELGVNS